MKKLRGVLLILLVVQLIVVTGCSDNKSVEKLNSSFNYATDMQYIYHLGGANVPMTKSDTGYYYVGKDNIVIYVDKESKKATPLCSKPNCMHDSPETCDAYVNISDNIIFDSMFGSIGTAIQYYDGSLYMVCGEYDKSYIEYNTYLVKMSPDGSSREQVTDYFDFNFIDWFIHRGYFYFYTDSELLRLPINSLKSEPEVIYKAKYYIKDGKNVFRHMCAYDDYLYFTAVETDDNGDGDGWQNWCINVKTLEKTAMPYFKDYQASVICFAGDKMVINYYDEKNDKSVYLKSNLEGKNYKKIFSQNQKEIENPKDDGKYYYSQNASSVHYGIDKEPIITVRDKDFNKIDTFKLPVGETAVCNFFNAQDEDCFLLEEYKDGKRWLVMADKSQIGSIGGKTIQYTELCSLDWAGETEKPYVEG